MTAQRIQGDPRYVWAVADLPRRRTANFDIQPDAAACGALAAELGVLAVRKLRFQGALLPEGAEDWRLDAQLGATVVQPCIATLDPVNTRIDEPVTRRFVAGPGLNAAPGSETEMTGDETEDPLGAEIDLWAVLSEALALALPAYPRAPDAAAADAVFAAPGVVPMTDDEARPFAGLADLKAKLDKNG